MAEAPKTKETPEQTKARVQDAEQVAAGVKSKPRKVTTPKRDPQSAPQNPPKPLTITEQLRQKFPAGVVKSRSIRGKDFDYVAIDATIGRLLDTMGLEWSFTNCTYDVQPAMVARRDADDVPGWQCIVTGELVIHDTTGHESRHWGVGADIADDLDKALKTALAEALKKAGHQLGIGLYLWNDEDRQSLARERKLVSGNMSALKTELVKRSGLILGENKEDNQKALAEIYHVLPEQLEDPEVVKQLLGVA